jgi:S-adenosylmethionine decarboxylase
MIIVKPPSQFKNEAGINLKMESPDKIMTHILLDGGWLEESTTGLLEDEASIREIFDGICSAQRFTVLHRVFHFFEPQGVTCVYVLGESHLSIHTWPERGEAAIDVFTCGERNSKEIAEFFCKAIDSDCDCNAEVVLR